MTAVKRAMKFEQTTTVFSAVTLLVISSHDLLAFAFIYGLCVISRLITIFRHLITF